MDSGWAAFLGAIVGSVIGAGTMLAADWLRHKRRRKETVGDILIKERIDTYNELQSRLFELWWPAPLLQTGLEPFRWPKNPRISPQFFEPDQVDALKKETELAQRIGERLEKLEAFVHRNTMLLAPSVQLEFWKAYHEFIWWRIRMIGRDDGELMPHFEEIEAAFDNLRRKPCDAIMKDLDTQGFNLVSGEALRNVREEIFQRLHARMNAP